MTTRFDRLVNGPIRQLLDGADALIVSEPQNVFLVSDVVPPTLRLLPERLLMPVFHTSTDPFWVIADITEDVIRRQSRHITDQVVYTEYRESPIGALVDALKRRGLSHQRILVEKNHLSAGHYEELAASLPGVTIDDATPALHDMRAVKSPDEQHQLQYRANATLRALSACYAETRIGDTETEIRQRAIQKLFTEGFDTLEFVTLARGRGDLLNGVAGDTPLQRGDMLRVDIGGTMAGWRSDIHRTAVAGTPPPRLKDAWRKNREVHYAAMDTMRAGRPVRETYATCVREYERRGMHCDMPFVGHSLGVGQHEFPVLTPFAPEEYKSGMVIMLEPMGIDPDNGGFSIEDMILVTDNDPVVLSDAVETEEMIVIGD
ncbi:aminopeptidase P family protein [Streptomyces bathyalis]|uniref:Aminopeptidase P family protein n=1 Tax=Streptomyces bathyalis TaxID=2710756 RepID=A0A7T1WQH5_9ACTN|nr:Xaa-Pro peptidase family protein [Streptomyces bathyalis]QPP05304.1 aminopeptidase P family protein [Streptomyces bathyalis]